MLVNLCSQIFLELNIAGHCLYETFRYVAVAFQEERDMNARPDLEIF